MHMNENHELENEVAFSCKQQDESACHLLFYPCQVLFYAGKKMETVTEKCNNLFSNVINNKIEKMSAEIAACES